ncbi:hypothetical protein [Aeromicrobium sp. A1-2]|uniref:hypothetical protein n=1 Tax=Aeromicrobium sp. A1-2 TaxID=2107713 RepID=UPI0013C320E0|nr:hypothetical protein [Aeromicrobium sp. A1-2]
MDESSFEIDSAQIAEASRRFPAHRLAPRHPGARADVSYLATTPGAEFGRHAWDEAGHL